MTSSLPLALILGVDHFVARKLVRELAAKDIKVLGIGEYSSELIGIKNFEYRSEIEEIVDENFDYIFDFKSEGDVWENHQLIGEKITVVAVDDEDRMAEMKKVWENSNLNWRMVAAFGVYGPGMEDHSLEESFNNKNLLSRVLRQAVMNRNLILPPKNKTFRILNIDDLVEAILRASFLSSTEKEIFLVLGNETNSEELAKVLIDEAKMTRFKVVQKEFELDNWNEEKITDSGKKLRWQPQIEFKDGLKETLQYYFSKIDEESRRGKVNNKLSKENQSEKKIEKKIETKGKVMFAVEVEEKKLDKPENEIEINKNKIKLKKKKKKIIRVEEEDDDGWDTVPVFKKIEWPQKEIIEIKNSNLRPVAGNPKIEVKVEEKKAEVKPEKKSKLKLRVNGKFLNLGLGVLLLVLLVSPISWIGSSVFAYKNIKKVEELIKNGEYKEAVVLADKQRLRVKAMDNKINSWGFNKIEVVRNYQSLLKVAEEVLVLEKKVAVLVEGGEKVNKAMFGEEENLGQDRAINWGEEVSKLENNLKDMETEIGGVQARLSGDWNWLPAKLKPKYQEGKKELEEARKNVGLLAESIGILPEFVGGDGGRRDYLVLFQNETELRPGGGFVGSYGILSFEGGKLLSLDIKDVYEADGQLKGHVEPPEEIKTHLGEAGWFMRDANWDASFVNNSANIQWFLEKETGRKVNGVIGINLAVAKSILGVVGEVYVPDFKEKINKDNLYEQAEFYSETKFFPGSNQKASFLGGLGKQLFEAIKTLKNEQRMDLIKETLELLEKNEIQVVLNNNDTKKTIADLGWDGGIYQGSCGKENCLTDYLYLVEANLGVNKANYFLYRNIEQMVDISNRMVTRVVKINYENTAKNSNWPGGDYKNYLRIYLPKSVNLAGVSWSDGANPNLKTNYDADQLKIKEVNGKKEVGFLVVVPVASKRIVEIRYTSEINLDQKDNFSYVHYIQRQSGFGDTGLVTLVTFPEGWQPVQVQPAATLVSGKLLFNQKLDRDIKIGVEIGK